MSCLRALALKEQIAFHACLQHGIASVFYASRLGWSRNYVVDSALQHAPHFRKDLMFRGACACASAVRVAL